MIWTVVLRLVSNLTKVKETARIFGLALKINSSIARPRSRKNTGLLKCSSTTLPSWFVALIGYCIVHILQSHCSIQRGLFMDCRQLVTLIFSPDTKPATPAIYQTPGSSAKNTLREKLSALVVALSWLIHSSVLQRVRKSKSNLKTCYEQKLLSHLLQFWTKNTFLPS